MTSDEIAAKEAMNESIILQDIAIAKASSECGSGGATGTRAKGLVRNKEKVIPWTELLREWTETCRSGGWDAPINMPIFQSSGLVGAGRRGKTTGHFVLVNDTSGSVPDDIIAEFMNQARDIQSELRPEAMTIMSVSHYVCDHQTVDADEEIHDLTGGGGTKFAPAFEWVRDNLVAEGEEVKGLVYLTDGHTDDLPAVAALAPGYPVLWIIWGNNTTFNPPVGDVIFMG